MGPPAPKSPKQHSPKPVKPHVPVNPRIGVVLPGGRGRGGMVPPGGSGRSGPGSIADLIPEFLKSPGGRFALTGSALRRAEKICKELKGKRKTVPNQGCDCCEVTLGRFDYRTINNYTGYNVHPTQISYWENTSCLDVQRYNQHKEDSKGRGFWPASANYWVMAREERNHLKKNNYKLTNAHIFMFEISNKE